MPGKNNTQNKNRNSFIPTDDAKRVHADFVAEIRKRELSGIENFDKSILAYSTGGLALSLGFLKDFVPIKIAFVPWALYGSWLLFAVATSSTVISFLISGKALRYQEQLSYKYYWEGDESSLTTKNPYNIATYSLNYLSAGCFLVGITLTVFFISLNLEQGGNMSRNIRPIVFDGATTPTMQKIQQTTSQKGATSPTMQKVPSSTPTPTQQTNTQNQK